MPASNDNRDQPDPLADELTQRILDSAGGRRLLAMNQQEMSAFLTSAESSLSVRASEASAVKATIEDARVQTRRRIDVVLDGPGVTALALAGALVALEESGYVVQNCAGSSGGALVAALDACGYTAADIRDNLLSTDFATLRDEATLGGRLTRSAKEAYSGDKLEQRLQQLMDDKGVRTFADLSAQLGMAQSGSVRGLHTPFGATPVAALQIVTALLLTHPSYGGGSASSHPLPPAGAGAPQRPLGAWLSSVQAVYRPDPDFLLDGRRVISGLAYIDDDVFTALSADGFLAQIEAELSDIEADLNEAGRRIRAGRWSGRDVTAELAALEVASAAEPLSRLQILVSEVSVDPARPLILPRDASELGTTAAELELPVVVRMSMSQEGAFPPYLWKNQRSGVEQLLADGGRTSSFPVSLFDVSDDAPLWPTFGIRVVNPAAPRSQLDARDATRTIAIAAEGFSGAEYEISRAEALRLYNAGLEACRDFLTHWDFNRYLEQFRSR